MTHRTLARLLLVGLLACSGRAEELVQPTDEQVVSKARGIHERVISIDSHVDIPPDFATARVDPGVRGERQIDIPRMIEGGLDAAFFAVFVGQTERTPENYKKAGQDAMRKFDAIHRMAERMHPDKIELAHTAADVERIHNDGKLVACIGIENGYVIGKDLGLLGKYHRLGARYMTLAHFGHNDISDSNWPQKSLGDAGSEHDGISEFGQQVIEAMNRLGIMVDVSHVSRKAMLDAVRISKAPVIASHSSTRAVCNSPGNLDDEQLLALKENGGVLQTVAFNRLVKNPPERRQAIRALRAELGIPRDVARNLPVEQRKEFLRRRAELEKRWPAPNVSDFIDHIDHAVQLIGIDHVGISSDFGGGGGVEGWNDASETLNVTVELVRRGYTEPEIAKLWGGNLLRVWRENERVAAELQSKGGK